MSKAADYREHFHQAVTAKNYDVVAYASGQYDTILEQIESRVLADVVRRVKSRRKDFEYLDFACGTGRITRLVEDAAAKSYGLDIAPAMLERAAARVTRTTLVQGDLSTDDSLVPGPFDLITTFRFVLNAQPELRQAALARLAARLRDDESLLVFNAHGNPHSVLAVRRAAVKLGLWKSDDERNHLSRSECIALAKACHLRVESIRGGGLLGPWFSRALPHRATRALESLLARVPLLHLFGVDLVVVCRRA